MYRADLADMLAKSAVVSQLIITLVTKLYNNTQHPMKNEILREEVINCHKFYACESIVSITKAAMMFHTHPPGCSTRPIVWLTNQLTYAYMGALEQGLVQGGTQTRALMRDHLDARAASINNYYKENLFRPNEVSRIRSSINTYLCEDTECRSLVTYQKDREGHKQRWEVPAVGAGLFFQLRRKMFGENQRVDTDLVGNQDEVQARRSIYATKKLIVSVGRLMSLEEIQAKEKSGKPSGRESSRTRGGTSPLLSGTDRDEGKGKNRGTTTITTDPEREKAENNPEREDSVSAHPRGREERWETDADFQGWETWRGSFMGDYRPPPADRDRHRGREGGRRDEQSGTEARHPERSRSVREPTVSFQSPQREDEDVRGIRLPARAAETGAETTGDENINLDATHVGVGRTRGKMSVRSTASTGEESQAERQRRADREARLKSKVKQPRDDDDDDVMT